MLEYFPDTGMFVWKHFRFKSGKRNSQFAGKVAGSLSDEGYVVIVIEKRIYKAHRLAWYGMTDIWPEDQIDHKNNVRSDNRWCNLREATNQTNQFNRHANKNSKLGVKGVHIAPNMLNKPYKVMIRKDGKKFHLGYFATIEEAKAAYDAKENELAGDYAKSNWVQ